MNKEKFKKYLSTVFMILILMPIYHIPVFSLTLMILTGILGQVQNSLFSQVIVALIVITMEIAIHSLPNIFWYKILRRKNEKSKEKFILSETLVIILVILSYIILFAIPLIWKLWI